MQQSGYHAVYLEVGKHKAFALALEWPGWCRSGKNEESALQALLDSAPRYKRILEPTRLFFEVPKSTTYLTITERVQGNVSTDFGAPTISIPRDQDQPSPEEVERYKAIFQAAWIAFDQAAQSAEGKELRKGPRGGGRELAAIIEHVAGADLSYLNSLGWKVKTISYKDASQHIDLIRSEVLKGIDSAAAGLLPTVGPKGAKKWTLRFFARYATWHVVDHTWEIEDRII